MGGSDKSRLTCRVYCRLPAGSIRCVVFSQGSAATLFRRVEQVYNFLMCRFLVILYTKHFFKIGSFFVELFEIKMWWALFFETQCVCVRPATLSFRRCLQTLRRSPPPPTQAAFGHPRSPPSARRKRYQPTTAHHLIYTDLSTMLLC